MTHDLIPYKRPGEDVTAIADGAITGKRCVQLSAAKDNKSEGLAADAKGNLYHVNHPSGGVAGVGKGIFGVAKYDAAQGGRVGVVREGIVPIKSSGPIAAGAEVQAAADGTVVTVTGGIAIGWCCNDCLSGDDAEIALYEGFGTGVDTGDITQQPDILSLADNSNGDASVLTPPAVASINVAMTGVSGAGNNAASKADVDAVLQVIADNFATLVADTTAIKVALRAAGLLA